MKLSELRAGLVAHGVTLSLTPEGKVKPTAAQPPPPELIEGMKAHRDHLAQQLQQGRGIDGRLAVIQLAQLPGRCGCCARWTLDKYGDGLCHAGRAAHGWLDGNPNAPVITTPHHICAAFSGQGWKAKGGTP